MTEKGDDIDRQAARARRWEDEHLRAGHEYQPTPATVARRLAEERRDEETETDESQ